MDGEKSQSGQECSIAKPKEKRMLLGAIFVVIGCCILAYATLDLCLSHALIQQLMEIEANMSSETREARAPELDKLFRQRDWISQNLGKLMAIYMLFSTGFLVIGARLLLSTARAKCL
jgi:hypothetical protein